MSSTAPLSSLLTDMPGLRTTLVCDRHGQVLEGAGEDGGLATRESAVALAVFVRQLERAGESLRLGPCQQVVTKGRTTAQVIAIEPQAIALVSCEGRRPTADIEARLLTSAWAPTAPAAPSPPRPAAREAVFTGQLQLFCLPDLLEFLRSGRRTGRLVCESPAGVGVVRMRRGMVTGAWSPRVARLGEYLVRHAVVTPEQVREAVQEQRDVRREDNAGARAIGRVLIERQAATAGDVRTALVAQIQDAIRELKDWMEGQFTFEPEPPVEPTLADFDIELDPQSILLTLFKEEDEAQRDAG